MTSFVKKKTFKNPFSENAKNAAEDGSVKKVKDESESEHLEPDKKKICDGSEPDGDTSENILKSDGNEDNDKCLTVTAKKKVVKKKTKAAPSFQAPAKSSNHKSVVKENDSAQNLDTTCHENKENASETSSSVKVQKKKKKLIESSVYVRFDMAKGVKKTKKKKLGDAENGDRKKKVKKMKNLNDDKSVPVLEKGLEQNDIQRHEDGAVCKEQARDSAEVDSKQESESCSELQDGSIPVKQAVKTSFQIPGKSKFEESADGQVKAQKDKTKKIRQKKMKDYGGHTEVDKPQKKKKVKGEKENPTSLEKATITHTDYEAIFRAVIEGSITEEVRTTENQVNIEDIKEEIGNESGRDAAENQYQHSDNFEGCVGNLVQQLNEVTPEGSEVDCEVSSKTKSQSLLPPDHAKKPKKFFKKIPSKQHEPRQLQFPKPSINTNKREKKKEKSKQKGHDPEFKKKQTINRKEMFINRNISNLGTWVQCCSCQKWRFLSEVDDPTEIPDKWFCHMNTDENFNTCEKKEQYYNEDEHIFTRFSEGSVVWARISGYPWWPAMIEEDPDTESFYEVATSNSLSPTHYHVVFFDDKVTRAWVRSSSIIQFAGKEHLDVNLKNGKLLSNYKREIAAAKVHAVKALELSVQERLKRYSFGVRFTGKWCRSIDDSAKDVKLKPKKKQKVREERTKRKNKKIVNEMIEDLDDSTVDEILDNPEDVLRGFEEVLESIDSSDALSDEDSDFVPSEEGKTISPSLVMEVDNKSTSVERKDKAKDNIIMNKSKKKYSKTAKENELPHKCDKDDPKNINPKKRKINNCKNKGIKQRKLENQNNSKDNENVEYLIDDVLVQVGDNVKLKDDEELGNRDIQTALQKESRDIKKEVQFDSDIFTMEMHSEEDLDLKNTAINELTSEIIEKKTDSKQKTFVPPKLILNVDSKEMTDSLKSDESKQETHLSLAADSENTETNIMPDEQTVPSLDLQAKENESQDFDNELTLDIPLIAISKHAVDNDTVNTEVAVLVTNNDEGEESDPFDMEE